MAHRREAPKSHDDNVADARANLIDKASRAKLAQSVEERKERHHCSVALFGQADAVIGNALHQRGLEKRKNLAIHVVDGGGGKQHGADGPAHVTQPRAGGRALCLLHLQFRHALLLTAGMLSSPVHRSTRALLRRPRLLPAGARQPAWPDTRSRCAAQRRDAPESTGTPACRR